MNRYNVIMVRPPPPAVQHLQLFTIVSLNRETCVTATCLQVTSGRLISSSISSVARCKPTCKASSTHDNTCGTRALNQPHTKTPKHHCCHVALCFLQPHSAIGEISFFYLYTFINCWRNSGYHQSTPLQGASLHPHPMPAAPSLQFTCFQNIKFTSYSPYSLTDHPGLLQVWMRAE